MPAPATLEEFLDLILRSGVLDEKRLDAGMMRLRAAGTIPSEMGKVAGLFVRDGLLTHFQAEQFLQGKWRRFTIGKYKVLEKIASGGMGSVYLCEHKFMRRRAAVKVLPTAKANDPSALERFYREARAVAALDHPNIVRAYDIDQEENLHFLVMEYVDGSSIYEVVKSSGPLDPVRAAHYVAQAAQGLQHAHEVAGLVHRDIKPGNLIVDRGGTVKVLDMGLARFFNDEEDLLTKKYDENVLGTADYLAPEQALDSHGVDIRADIYSLGATFYFCLTGKTPFSDGTVAQKLIWHQTRQPKSVRAFRSDVPEEIIAIVEKMMAKDPENRFQLPIDVARALSPWTNSSIAPPAEAEMPKLSPAAMAVSIQEPEPVAAVINREFDFTNPAPTPPKPKPAVSPVAAIEKPVAKSAAPPKNKTPTEEKQAPARKEKTGAPATAANKESRETPFWPASASSDSATDLAAAFAFTSGSAAEKPAAKVTPAPSAQVEIAPAPLRPEKAVATKKQLSAKPAGPEFVMPAAESPTPEDEESIPWQSFAHDTKKLSAEADTQKESRKQAASSPDPGMATPVKLSRRRLWLIVGTAGAGVALLAVIIVLAVSSEPKKEKVKIATLWTVNRSGGAGDVKTLGDALRQAKPGDRIVVADEFIEEQFELHNQRQITIEAQPGKTVIWKFPEQSTETRRLLFINNAESVRISGFDFDGRDRVDTILTLSGQCPGLILENLRLKGFKKSGLVIANCAGTKERPITFTDVRATSATETDAAIDFTANPSITNPRTNQFLAFKDCTFIGKFKKVIQRSGPDAYSDVTWKNVTVQPDSGKPPSPLELP